MKQSRPQNDSLLARAKQIGQSSILTKPLRKEKPVRLLLEVLLLVFLCQMIVMSMLYAVQAKSRWDIALHCALLGLVLVGVLYRLFVRPMNKAIEKSELAAGVLESGEHLYRTLYNSSTAAIVLSSPQQGIIAANPAAVTLFGCADEQDLVSRSLDDLLPASQPEGAPSLQKLEKMASLALENGSHTFEFTYRKADGAPVPADVLLTATVMNKQTVLQATINDASEKAALQGKLKEHLRHLNCLYELSKLIEAKEIQMQQVFEQTLKLVRSAYHQPGKTAVRITFDGVKYSTENFEKTELSRRAVIKLDDEEAGAIEVYYLAPKNAETPNPFLDTEKELLSAVAEQLGHFAQQKQIADKLQLFRDLTDRSNDCICILEPLWGRFIDVNDRACEILGYPREELMHMSLTDIDQGLTANGNWKGFVDDLRKKGHLVVETTHRTKSANVFDAEINAKIIIQNNKEYLLAVSRDITERKKAQQQQQKLMEELEAVNQELKDFAYIVSHDLKAPLRGIKALTEWITADYGDKFDEDGKEQLRLLGSRVNRMHNLIDGVLQYSRVGRVQEELSLIDLNALLPDVVDSVSAPDNIQITVQQGLPTIRAEQTRIQQLFQNLLSNAVKYMDKPEGHIQIGCTRDGSMWKFSVTDNGPGIEEQHFSRIFKIFQTLKARDEFESTGVGLTVVKKIVEMYGGRIWVESKVGEGTTFFFTVPAGCPADADSAPSSQQPAPQSDPL